jgi:hypothetical protein
MMPPNVKPFLFIHIRKAAGTSLRSLLLNQFPHDRALLNAHSVNGPQEPRDALFVTGHVDFNYTLRFSVAPTVFTVLRDPLSLALSAYYFFRSNDEQFFRGVANDWSPAAYESRRQFTDRSRRLDFFGFLTEEESLARKWLSNTQTRQLVGAIDATPDSEDSRLLEAALSYLQKCDLVGLVERLEDTLLLLGQSMNWGRLGPLPHENKTARPTDIDPRCIDILRSWNSMDLRLYEVARHIFEEKMTALDRHFSERAVDSTFLPDGRSFTPEMRISGYGWHQREFHQGKWLCWNSATTATLHLLLAGPRPVKFRCRLSHVISQKALDQLRISLNAVPLALLKQPVEGAWLLEAPIPGQALDPTSHLAVLAIDCPVMQRPCDIDPHSADARNLGVAIECIQIA